MTMPDRRLLICAALLLACDASHAAGVVIYRCTDPSGALTVQNDMPCPKGSKQQKQVIQAPPPMPAYRPSPSPAVAQSPPTPSTPAPAALPDSSPATEAAPPPAIADSERLPPPVLYQCNTYDHDSYLSEDDTPEPRCVRLQTTDLSGAPDASGGVACQMVTDQCQRVADGAACDAWKKRLREVEAAWKFGHADEVDANKSEYERVARIVRDSTCGK